MYMIAEIKKKPVTFRDRLGSPLFWSQIAKRCLACAIMSCVFVWIAFPFLLSLNYGRADIREGARVYYIAAEEVDWNYLPTETELSENRKEYGKKYLEHQKDPFRIGHIYRKAVFREYTNGTYSELKKRHGWLGILGPLLFGEVGDILEIHLVNNLTRPVSLHTHGVFYEKHSEGAPYQDNSEHRKDDQILPGESYTYIWNVSDSRSPTDSDPDCMIWPYHSHVFGDTDIHSGLIGPLIACKEGHLSNEMLTDFLNQFVLLFLTFDENQSWYIEDNIINAASNLSKEEVGEIREDESFIESNLMLSINGYMYDTVPELQVCLGSSITWYIMGMGNEADMHSVTFEGHTLLVNHRRTDVVHLFPGQSFATNMVASHEGRWPIRSEVGEHFLGGMEASFVVKKCSDEEIVTDNKIGNKTRKYYIAAEETFWNYAPTGYNNVNSISLLEDNSEAATFFKQQEDRIGGTYKKAIYTEYTDESFSIRKDRPKSAGILGPVIRAEVGDNLEITFYNNATVPYSFHSRPLVCENCDIKDVKGTPVNPGDLFVYQFLITADLGPAKNESSCIAWKYFSDVDSLKDTYSGLIGLLLVCEPGSLTDEGRQKDADEEFALMLGVIDENESHYIEDNIKLFISNDTKLNRTDPEFIESNLMHSINGLMYGNLFGLVLCRDDKVSWLLMGIGGEVDLHVVHFWGNSVFHQNRYTNTIELYPGSHEVVTMVPDAEGSWMLQCQTNDHLKGGMQAKYLVKKCDKESMDFSNSNGTVREYFLKIVEEEWDYAPSHAHGGTGENITENSDSSTYVTRDETHIGSRYIKAVFREYNDSTFNVRVPFTRKQDHLGFLGPIIKAEVGETIQITVFNNASNPYNIRPDGVFDATNNKDDAVEPGMIKVYTWIALPRSGPISNGFNCINWMYSSTVDEVKDTNSGLVGPLVICKPGILNSEGRRIDVDEEFSLLLTVTDENESWYLNQNIQKYCLDPASVDPEDEDFKESNLKHSINGRLYGSLEGLSGIVGDKVAWYLMGLGNEVDLHTIHFHGLTALEEMDTTKRHESRVDVISVSPGVYRTVEMLLDAEGKWMIHCHVDDHLKAGMFAMISVER